MAVILALAGSIAYYRNINRQTPAQYITAPVKRGNVAVALTATGTVNPVTVVEVGTYVSGPIAHWYCDFNARVTVGQLCAQIDPRPFQVTADQTTANLAVAKAQLRKDQASLAYAKTTYERDVGLLKPGIVAQTTVDSDKSAYDQALAQVSCDEASIQERQAEVHAAQVNLGFTQINLTAEGTYQYNHSISGAPAASNSVGSGRNNSLVTSMFSIGPALSYTPDLFGQNRRLVEQASALAENQSYQLASAYLTLTADAVTQAVTIASTLAQIKTVNDIIAVDDHNLDLVRIAFTAGSVARTDVLSAKVSLPTIERCCRPSSSS